MNSLNENQKDMELRKKVILANWNLLSEQTKELLKSIGIDGDVEYSKYKNSSPKGVQTLLADNLTQYNN